MESDAISRWIVPELSQIVGLFQLVPEQWLVVGVRKAPPPNETGCSKSFYTLMSYFSSESKLQGKGYHLLNP